MRGPALAAILAVFAGAVPAQAESAADALVGFGLIGTWSPDCTGPIRVTYTLRSGGPPTATAVINGTEQAITEIEEASRPAPDRIRWSAVYRKYVPIDTARQSWMPEPGETWETVLQRSEGKIRSLTSQRADGAKVLVGGGFYYVPDEAVAGRPTIWRKTDQPTPFFVACGANK